MPEIEVNGLRVHYQLVGQPADRAEGTIVMIHGLAIDNLSSLYYALAPGVADRMRVVLYDLRGHGRSERPATGYGVDQAVEDLWALLDTLDIRTPVYLLGNSYGGTIALEAAHRNPERVRGLVLVEGHVAVPGWGEHIVAQLELAKFGFSVTDLSRWLSSRPQRKLATMAKVVHALVHDTSVIKDFAAGRTMEPDDLRSIDCPVYALYGEYSDIIERADHIEGLLPRCELDILSDCSHSAMMEATRTMRALVSDWIDRVEAGKDVPGRRRTVAPAEDEGHGAENRQHVDRFIDELNSRRDAAIAQKR
jgi:pimeloyl-ACP methyl ester carboxylesterase